ncbi:hypothetical protein FJ365_04160 [Candidatus Dependentiae bacterium]|nr:hypothetical protein [Candidatus Dependentiae bacterium]
MNYRSILCSLLLILSVQQVVLARGEGGAFAGSLVGSMVGSAIIGGSSHSKASTDADQIRIEQERQRVNQLEREMDRREMDRKIAQAQQGQGQSTLFMALVALVIVLLFGVMALGILILRKKP